MYRSMSSQIDTNKRENLLTGSERKNGADSSRRTHLPRAMSRVPVRTPCSSSLMRDMQRTGGVAPPKSNCSPCCKKGKSLSSLG